MKALRSLLDGRPPSASVQRLPRHSDQEADSGGQPPITKIGGPANIVLHAMRTQPERWTLVTHRNDDPDLVKLAVEIVERLLPARHNAQPTIAGRPLPPDEFPLTMSFIVRAAAVCGIRLGQKRAYQVRREALTILDHTKNWPRRARYSLTLYQLRLNPLQRHSRNTPLSPTPTPELLSAKPGCQDPARTNYGRYGPRLPAPTC